MRYFKIPNSLLFSFSGKDARRYLHNRSTVDVKSLLPLSCCKAGILSATGKLEVFCRILCLSDIEFLVLVDGGNLTEVSTSLRKFIVADRVEVLELNYSQSHVVLEEEAEFQTLARFCGWSDLTPTKDNCFAISNNFILLENNRGFAAGFDLINRQQSEEKSLDSIATQISDDEQFARRCLANIPKFPEELAHNLIFSETPLSNSVSFTKGCYVGQEVIEKIDARGKAPRKLVTFSTTDPIDSSFDLESSKNLTAIISGVRKPFGEIISTRKWNSFVLGFAIVKNCEYSNPLLGENNISIRED